MTPANTHVIWRVCHWHYYPGRETKWTSQFQKWPRHSAVDNCIICWFNQKYKTLCTHHCRQLWYTSWRLMHRGTPQMWWGIWASFRQHNAFRNLIGLHLSSWSNLWLRLPFQALRTSYSTGFFSFFSPLWLFFTFDRACCSHSIVTVVFLAFNFFHSVHLLYPSDLVLYRLCDYINTIFHLAVGELALRSTWKKSCRLPVHLHTVLQQSIMLYQ